MKFRGIAAHFIGGLLLSAAFPEASEMSKLSKFISLEESSSISACLLNIASDAAFGALMSAPFALILLTLLKYSLWSATRGNYGQF